MMRGTMTVEPNGSGGEGAAASSRGVVGGRNLPVAIAVGVIMAALFLVALFWHPVAFAAVVGVLVCVAYLEADRVLRTVGTPLQVPVLIVSTLLMLFGAFDARHAGQMAGVVALFLGAVVWQLADRDRQNVLPRLSVTLMFGLWVGFLASFAILLVARTEAGAVGVLAVIGSAILSDIGGYGFGVAFGRRKVAPTVSPNKTWEGLIGGLVLSTAGATLALPLLDERFTLLLAAAIGFTCGLASFVGDLLESLIKRDLGVKDLGGLLPGHGGVLDRVDGVLVALPVGYLVLHFLY
jgi:phosphatidate cytidylyltransferase